MAPDFTGAAWYSAGSYIFFPNKTNSMAVLELEANIYIYTSLVRLLEVDERSLLYKYKDYFSVILKFTS